MQSTYLHNKIPELDIPIYPAAEVGRLVNLSSVRVRRWLKGYEYLDGQRRRHIDPVIQRLGTIGTSYASFLDLIDLLFVKKFLDHGLSLQRVRKALDEATDILGTKHFARESFFTDGRKIYLQVKDQGDAILELLSGGQWVIAEVILKLAEQIDFDTNLGFARRWYPMGLNGLIVLDPLISFGSPTIIKKGIATANVYDLFIAERQNKKKVCSWMKLAPEELSAAVQFEQSLAA